jgi:hypothetical protein
MRLNDDFPLHKDSYDKETANDLCLVYGDDSEEVVVMLVSDRAEEWFRSWSRKAQYCMDTPRGIVMPFEKMEAFIEEAEKQGIHVDGRSTAGPDV